MNDKAFSMAFAVVMTCTALGLLAHYRFTEVRALKAVQVEPEYADCWPVLNELQPEEEQIEFAVFSDNSAVSRGVHRDVLFLSPAMYTIFTEIPDIVFEDHGFCSTEYSKKLGQPFRVIVAFPNGEGII